MKTHTINQRLRRNTATALLFCAGFAAGWPAFGADAGKAAPTLCTTTEAVLFSCQIKNKTVSLCATQIPGTQIAQTLHYRFGIPGKPADLDYPTKEKPLKDAFMFSSTRRSFSLELASFSRNDIGYDVIMPDKTNYARWLEFSGVAVTLPQGSTQLMRCNDGSVVADLAPLKARLGLTPEQDLATALPKVPVDSEPFPVIKKSIPHGRHWVSTLSYPEIADPRIKKNITNFVQDCYDPSNDDDIPDANLSDEDRSECVRTVAARLINKRMLVLRFDEYEYHIGQAHGQGSGFSLLFRKTGNDWTPVKSADLFQPTRECRTLVSRLLNRKLAPLPLSFLDEAGGRNDDQTGRADISLDAQGVVFSFRPYDLGAYAEGPGAVMIPYQAFGACLRWQILKD